MARYRIALAALVGMMAPGVASATIVVAGGDGDFQSGGYTQNTEFGSSAPASGGSTSAYAPTGWSGSGYVLYYNGGTAGTTSAYSQYGGGKEKLYNNLTGIWATAGNYYVALDGDTNVQGSIWTTVTGLTVGSQYDVTFNWAASQLQSASGATTEQLAVSMSDGTNTSTKYTGVLNNASGGFVDGGTVTLSFTATAVSETLKFLSVGTPNGLPPIALLDNVSVKASVPEPTTMALMLSGVGALGFFGRRRRSSARA